MKRAVLYARVSTNAQQKEWTIESQVLELKGQIAASAGNVLVKEYIDDGYSGTLLDRPGLEEDRASLFPPGRNLLPIGLFKLERTDRRSGHIRTSRKTGWLLGRHAP